jgi:hypothetical protein
MEILLITRRDTRVNGKTAYLTAMENYTFRSHLPLNSTKEISNMENITDMAGCSIETVPSTKDVTIRGIERAAVKEFGGRETGLKESGKRT